MLEGNVTAGRTIQGKVKPLDIIYTDAYEIAVKNGFQGTIDEWLESIKGKPGASIVSVMGALFEELATTKVQDEEKLVANNLYVLTTDLPSMGLQKGDIVKATGEQTYEYQMNIIGAKGDRGTSIVAVNAETFDDLQSSRKLVDGNLYLISESDDVANGNGYYKGDIFLATDTVRDGYVWKMNIIGDKGDPGKDYVLTEDDKEEIAEQVFENAKPYIDNYMAAGILEARVG